MFEGARGTAVIAVSDLARARSFYEEVLGITPVEIQEEAQSVMYTLGGTPLLVYLSGFAGTAKNTVFAIETNDLDADMAELSVKGVEFQDYDFPGLRTTNGVAELPGERSAWFADSEGNILALNQRT
ncbi:VOC family protein [Microbacterium lacus]|uniref:VOC family protein n=1 Tax=Microbacterium lacus TaxID=415217 RepID=UPI00384BD5DC